MVKGLDTIWS